MPHWLAVTVNTQPSSFNGIAFLGLFTFCILALVVGWKNR